MRKVLLALLALVVVLGALGAAGYTGYRFGYAQGAQLINNPDVPRPGLRPFDEINPRGMPRDHFGFGRGFERGIRRGGFPLMGLGFFSPLLWLSRLAVLALIVWFIYWLFARSGWRLTRETAESTPPKSDNEQVM